MTVTEDRPTCMLDRPQVWLRATDRHEPAAPPAQRQSQEARAVPLGWGSHAERRLMRQVLGFFALLGMYAVAFVLVGTVVWT